LSDLKEYTQMMHEAARAMWGEERAKEMRAHIEVTSKAVWVIGNTVLDPGTEPATKLNHRREADI
jgi:hypothetical protein